MFYKASFLPICVSLAFQRHAKTVGIVSMSGGHYQYIRLFRMLRGGERLREHHRDGRYMDNHG